MKIHGINGRDLLPDKILSMICVDFYKFIPFSAIASQYNLSTSLVVKLFDKHIPYIPRKQLPKVLCIDEKKFNDETGSKYCCIIYDFINKEVVDVFRSKRLDYLEEYFSSISEKERDGVSYFVSDMNDAYCAVARRYFKKATHIIDLFHIIRLLTTAVNTLRIKAMKRTDSGTVYYRIMKKYLINVSDEKTRYT